MSQEAYDEFSLNTNIEVISRMNAPFLNVTEKSLIRELKPNKVLDIGSGNGVRLFDHLELNNIAFKGIEKFERLFQNSRYSDHIIHGDVTKADDVNSIDFAPDLITILGGSINGIFGMERQEQAWVNLINKLQKGDHLIFDHLVYPGFENASEIGETYLGGEFPVQFFLSINQLEIIWSNLGMDLIKSTDIRIGSPYPLRYFVLRKV
jgi:SAM-dependent methyltransferase